MQNRQLSALASVTGLVVSICTAGGANASAAPPAGTPEASGVPYLVAPAPAPPKSAGHIRITVTNGNEKFTWSVVSSGGTTQNTEVVHVRVPAQASSAPPVRIRRSNTDYGMTTTANFHRLQQRIGGMPLRVGDGGDKDQKRP
jgi:hypothetical protein